MQSKLFGIISLSRKAGQLIYGFDSVKEAVLNGKAKMVIFASDVSDRTRRSMEHVMDENNAHIARRMTPLPMFEYARICGKPTGVLALMDKGFADAARKLLADEED